MSQKTFFLDHHKILGILFLALMLTSLPLFLWALTNPTQIFTRAYFPKNCEIPKIPRTEVCSTDWKLVKNEKGCRIFICAEKPQAQTPLK